MVAIEKEREWTEANQLKATKFKKSDNIVRPEFVTPTNALQSMDTTIEGFFRKRDMNSSNFNLLLLSLNAKRDLKTSLEVHDKMIALGIPIKSQTYDILISTCAKAKDIQTGLKFFEEASKRFGKSIALYTSLMSLYTRANLPIEAEKVFKEAIGEGLVPDVGCYTSVIQAFKYAHVPSKCFEYYDDMIKRGLKPDEVVVTVMMQVCSQTSDAEKAIRLFEDHRPQEGFYRNCFPYNGYIRALASREDYAERAEAIFDQMINYQVAPDADSFGALLLATSRTGNVKKAFNGLQLMKERGFSLNSQLYAGLIKTYAAAIKHNKASPAVVKEYKKDSWQLFKQAEQKGMLTTAIIDGLMLVHTTALDIDTVEGAILPIYEQKKLPMNAASYGILLQGLDDKAELVKIERLFMLLRDKLHEVTPRSLEIFLHTFIRLTDPVRTEEVLHTFLERRLHVKSVFLNSLGNSMNLPDTLYALLHKFDRKFGVIASKKFEVTTELKKGSIVDSIEEKLETLKREGKKRPNITTLNPTQKQLFSKRGEKRIASTRYGREILQGGDQAETDKFIKDMTTGSRK